MICSGITPKRIAEQNGNPTSLLLNTDIQKLAILKKFKNNDKNRKINTEHIISKKIKHFAKLIKREKKNKSQTKKIKKIIIIIILIFL